MRRNPDDYSAELTLPLSSAGPGEMAMRVSGALTASIAAISAGMFGAPRTFTLSDSAYAILRLAAAHDGVSESALLTRLICQHGARVGLPGLLDAAEVRRESG